MQNENVLNENLSSTENEISSSNSQDENQINLNSEISESQVETQIQSDENDESSQIKRNKKSYKHAYQEAVRQAEYYKLIAEQQAQQLINKVNSKSDEQESGFQDPMTKKVYAANSPEAIVAKVLMEREQEISNSKIQEEIQRKTSLGKSAILEAKEEIEGFDDEYQSVFSEISGDTYKAIRHEILASPNPVALIQYYATNLEDLKRIKSKSPDDQFREVVIASHSLKKKPKMISNTNPPLPKPHPQRNVPAQKVEDPSSIFKEEMQRIRNPFKKWGS